MQVKGRFVTQWLFYFADDVGPFEVGMFWLIVRLVVDEIGPVGIFDKTVPLNWPSRFDSPQNKHCIAFKKQSPMDADENKSHKSWMSLVFCF